MTKIVESWVLICTSENRVTANKLFAVLGLRDKGFDQPLSATGTWPATHYAATPDELPEFARYIQGEGTGRPVEYPWHNHGLTRQDAVDMLAESILGMTGGDPNELLRHMLEEHGLRVVEGAGSGPFRH